MKMKQYILLIVMFKTIFVFGQVKFRSSNIELGVREYLEIDSTAVISENTLDTITSINLSGYGIVDVSDISYFKQLKKLDISNNRIHDLSPLVALPYIQQIDISNNRITDITDFLFADNREFKLIVTGNQITDFSYFNEPIYSNVQLIGWDKQDFSVSPTYYLHHIYTGIDSVGQAKIYYDIWEEDPSSKNFTLNFGDGGSTNNLQCDYYTNIKTHTYNSEGYKDIELYREQDTLKTFFIAPYHFNITTTEEIGLDFNLPSEIKLDTFSLDTNKGKAFFKDKKLYYTSKLSKTKDTILVKCHKKDEYSNKKFMVFLNTNTFTNIMNNILSHIRIYPNPASESVTINLADEINNEKVTISDISGKIVYEQRFTGLFYFVKVGNITRKLLVE